MPELARGLGKGINEFKDAVNSGKEHIMDATDDIRLVKELGVDCYIVSGSNKNFKITTKLDLQLAKTLLNGD